MLWVTIKSNADGQMGLLTWPKEKPFKFYD